MNYFKGAASWETSFMKNYFIIYCIITLVVFFCTLQYWLDPLKSVYKQLKGKTA